MRLPHGLHLAFCPPSPGDRGWAETWAALQRHTAALRQRVCPEEPLGLGLALSASAARELADPATCKAFQVWLEKHRCYLLTLQGAACHELAGAAADAPDWTAAEQPEYTNSLCDLLARLLPAEVAGCVSTVPGAAKERIRTHAQANAVQANLWACIEHLDQVCQGTGRVIRLGLQPQPGGYLETTAEAALFFQKMRADRREDDRVDRYLGLSWDTSHLAVQFEEPAAALQCLQKFGILLCKIRLSKALRAPATPEGRQALRLWGERSGSPAVVERPPFGPLRRYRDLAEALRLAAAPGTDPAAEWRLHVPLPLHAEPAPPLTGTDEQVAGVLDALKDNPRLCPLLEIQACAPNPLALPALARPAPAAPPAHQQAPRAAEAPGAPGPPLREGSEEDSPGREWLWALARLRERGLAPAAVGGAPPAVSRIES